MTKRRAGVAAILLTAVLLGAVREFLFLNLNYSIDHLRNHRAFSYAHSQFQAIADLLTLDQLVMAKWALSLVFAAVMLGLAILLARVLFADHRYRTVLVTGFVVIGAIALLLQSLSSGSMAMQGISVKLLHVTQYPVLLLFLWAASLLRRLPDRPSVTFGRPDHTQHATRHEDLRPHRPGEMAPDKGTGTHRE